MSSKSDRFALSSPHQARKCRVLVFPVFQQSGAPEEIRTPDPQIRSLVLYPAELRARFSLGILGFEARMRSENLRKVAKERFSYPLRVGLARSGRAVSARLKRARSTSPFPGAGRRQPRLCKRTSGNLL